MAVFSCPIRRRMCVAAASGLLLGAIFLLGPTQARAATGGPVELTQNSGKCLDRDVASGRVQVWDCNGGTNQLWSLNANGTLTTGTVCLETPSGQTANNTLVDVSSCTGTSNQQWSHNGLALRNVGSGRCIDLPNGGQTNGNQLQVYDCINNPNQQWTMPAAAAGWTAAWGSAMQQSDPLNGGSNFTCRNISRITLSGTGVRIRLSNLYDTTPVTFTAVRVAQRDSGGSIVSGSSHVVTFNGVSSVTVPPGGEVLSDGVPMLVGAGEDLAVSTYIAGGADTYPSHLNGKVTHYCTSLSGGGNHVDDVSAAAYTGTSPNVPWVSGIDVAGGKGAVIVLGDSITDGVTADLDAYNRWPDVLAARLQAAGDDLGVINAGISGNGVVAGFNGDPGIYRFGRDVLGQTNASTVLLLLGTNDIAAGQSATTINNGLADLADRAHAAGLRVVGATLLARRAGWPQNLDQDAADATRNAVNDFIRHSAHFDAVVDFDPVMSNTDPNFPAPGDAAYTQYLRPDYTSDGTHPNVAGMAAMANAVDLNALLPSTGPRTGRIAWDGGAKCVDRDVASGHVQIWGCLAGSNQLWTLNVDGSVTTGGVCMELPPGLTANHTLVDVASCTGAGNQMWSRGAGSSLVNQAAGRCLDLDGGDYTNGRQLQVFDCVGGPNQVWTWS